MYHTAVKLSQCAKAPVTGDAAASHICTCTGNFNFGSRFKFCICHSQWNSLWRRKLGGSHSRRPGLSDGILQFRPDILLHCTLRCAKVSALSSDVRYENGQAVTQHLLVFCHQNIVWALQIALFGIKEIPPLLKHLTAQLVEHSCYQEGFHRASSTECLSFFN